MRKKTEETIVSAAPDVAIPLSKGKKRAVTIGCVMLMFTIAMFGLSLANLQGPILTEMNAMGSFSMIAILRVLPLSIMTPIGGKLGDLFGRRNVVLISGIIAGLSSILMSFVRVLPVYMGCIVVLSAAMGAFTAAPYIIAREINETSKVPGAMGLLPAAVAIGGFGGSIVAGMFQDAGFNRLALMCPCVPLIAALLLIGFNMPNVKREGKVTIDFGGMLLLTVALCGIILALNFGPNVGWSNIGVIAGIIIGIIATVFLFRYEAEVEEAIIPVKLLKNKKYAILLVMAFLCYFYKCAMDTYAPLGIQQVFGGSTTISGSLQLPRTIITMFLPIIAGRWIVKKTGNAWKAMSAATGVLVAVFAVMTFVTSTGYALMTGVAVYMIAIAFTGIAESCRAVSVTPTAQSYLKPEDYGIGTALVNFVASLANPFAAAFMGILYDIPTHSNPGNAEAIAAGLRNVFVLAGVSGLVGLLIVIFIVRKQLQNRDEEAALGSAQES